MLLSSVCLCVLKVFSWTGGPSLQQLGEENPDRYWPAGRSRPSLGFLFSLDFFARLVFIIMERSIDQYNKKETGYSGIG